MRLTTLLDDDIHLLLKEEMSRSGEGMKTVVNRALCTVLEARAIRTDEPAAWTEVDG